MQQKTNKTRMNKQAKNQSNKHDNMILFFSGNRSWWSAGSRERQFQGGKAETQVSLYSHVSSLVLISVLSCLRTWEGMQTCADVVGWGVGRKVGYGPGFGTLDHVVTLLLKLEKSHLQVY